MANKNESGTPENQGEIVIYQTDNGDTKIDVRFVDESVWLTQQQMAELFNPQEPISWSIFSTSMKKANWTRHQPVGNSDKFELRVIGRFQEKFLTTTSI